MDYVYGKVNEAVIKNTYTGGRTPTADVNVDNATNVITVNAHANTDYVEGMIDEKISQLTHNEQPEQHKFVTSVTEQNGVISTTKGTPEVEDIAGLETALQNKQNKITNTNKLPYDLVSGTPTDLSDFTNNGAHPYATQEYVGNEIDTHNNSNNAHSDIRDSVNAKYTKPSGGIPASDLAETYYLASNPSNFITNTVSNLINYYTKTNTYTKTEVNELISTLTSFTYVVVDSLPTASAQTMGIIYLVPSPNPQQQNIKDEYITIKEGSIYKWEQIGSTAVNLTDYAKKTWVEQLVGIVENEVRALDRDKVDKVSGKQLSTEDFTTALKNKLEDINPEEMGKVDDVYENGTSVLGEDKIARITVPTELSELTDDNTHRLVSDNEKTTWNNKQNTISDLETIRNGASKGATAVQPSDISDMATKTWVEQKSYVNSSQAADISQSVATPLISEAISQHNSSNDAHQDIRNAIPTKTSDITNDSGYINVSQAVAVANSVVDTHNEDTTAHSDIRNAIPQIVDNITSTATNKGLSANQGKLLNDRINNIATRGRFLSLWNCVTGLPLTNPSGYPYDYHTGDFFIVNNTGTTNYIPNGSQYTGQPSTTTYSGTIKINDTIFYDGTNWMVFDTPAGSGNVQDVYQNGESVLSEGIAYVVTPTKTSDLTNDGDTGNPFVTLDTIDEQIGYHNVSGEAHSDIRTQIGTDISTHNSSNSAHTDIRNAIPTKTSDLTNDSGFLQNASITVTPAMVIQQTPLRIQLTTEQYNVINDSKNDFIRIDATQLGIGTTVFFKSTSNDGQKYVLTMNECNYNNETDTATAARQDLIIIDKTSMIGTYTVLSLQNAVDYATSQEIQALFGGQITDLTGCLWVGNTALNISSTKTYNLSYSVNNTNSGYTDNEDNLEFYSSNSSWYLARDMSNLYYSGQWSSNFEHRILITGGSDATNTELITWFENNGTLTKL